MDAVTNGHWLAARENECYLLHVDVSTGSMLGILNTFKWLQTHHQLAPVKAEQLYSLRPIFSNKTMSLSVRPLLNPDSVAAALRTHIQPQNRSLNCFVTLPRPAKPFEFPEDFPPNFRRLR